MVGKNVTFTLENIALVRDYMNKTRKNFSQTVNIMLQDWDKITIEIAKHRRDIIESIADKEIKEQKQAKVIK